LLYIVSGVWGGPDGKRPILVGASLIRSVLLLWSGRGDDRHPVGRPAQRDAVCVGRAHRVVRHRLQSYLPTLVGREHLVEGNSRMESRGPRQVTGPSVGGLLVQAVTAPVASVLDGCRCSARVPDRPDPPPGTETGTGAARHHGVRADLMEGLRFLGRHPVLRAAVAIAINNIAWAAEVSPCTDLPGHRPPPAASLVGLTLIGSAPARSSARWPPAALRGGSGWPARSCRGWPCSPRRAADPAVTGDRGRGGADADRGRVRDVGRRAGLLVNVISLARALRRITCRAGERLVPVPGVRAGALGALAAAWPEPWWVNGTRCRRGRPDGRRALLSSARPPGAFASCPNRGRRRPDEPAA